MKIYKLTGNAASEENFSGTQIEVQQKSKDVVDVARKKSSLCPK